MHRYISLNWVKKLQLALFFVFPEYLQIDEYSISYPLGQSTKYNAIHIHDMHDDKQFM